MRRIVRFGDLKPRFNINYSRTHINRLEAGGKWPKRFRIVEGARSFGWWEDELVAHLEARSATRDIVEAA